MPQSASKSSRKPLIWLLATGLLGLVIWLIMAMRPRSNKDLIIDVLTTTTSIVDSKGITHKVIPLSLQQAEYWVCVSAFETAVKGEPWKSEIYLTANNLWGMTLASKNTTATGALSYGEEQCIYPSVKRSAEDILLYMQKRWKYPQNFATLDDLVDYMKSKGYFLSNVEDYKAGVNMFYDKLFR